MRVLRTGLVTAFAVLVLASPCFAVTEGTVQEGIAILDVPRILQEAAAIKALDDAYRNGLKSYATDTKAEEEELRRAEEELRRKQIVLSAEAFETERSKLQGRVARAMELVQERKRSLDLARQQGIGQVQAVLNRIVTEIANERDLTLILRKEQTVLVATDLEITDEVLRRLNAELPSVEATTPEN